VSEYDWVTTKVIRDGASGGLIRICGSDTGKAVSGVVNCVIDDGRGDLKDGSAW